MKEQIWRCPDSTSGQNPLLIGSVGTMESEPGETFERRHFAGTTLAWVPRGKALLRTAGREYAVGPGMVTLFHPGRTFQAVADREDPWVRRHVWIRGSLVQEILFRYGLSHTVVMDGSGAAKYFERLEATAKNNVALNVKMNRMAADVCALIIHLGSLQEASPSPVSHGVERLRRFLETHTTERLRLPEILARYGEKSAVIARAFKAEMGVTVYDYFLDRKLDHAARLLGDPSQTLERIAETLAFTDGFHLSRQFKKRRGLSPAAFRRKVGVVV